MKEYMQAGEFYESLSEAGKKDLAESIAADIFFLDDKLQENILAILDDISHELSVAVERINNFTI